MSEDPKTPSIAELIGLPAVDDAQISPDGKWVAFTVTGADWKQNEFDSQIWLVSVSEGGARQLTFARTSRWSPRWSKDGRWLAFLSKREGDEHTQIYRLSPFGGEAERLGELETDAAEEIRQRIVFIPQGKLAEAPLFALGCLYLAAEIAGDVTLEQRVVPGGLVQ